MTTITITDEQTKWIVQVFAMHAATATAETTDDACWIAWDQCEDDLEIARSELVRRTASMMECIAISEEARDARIGDSIEVPDRMIDLADLVDYTLHYAYGDDDRSHLMRWVRDRLSAFEAQLAEVA